MRAAFLLLVCGILAGCYESHAITGDASTTPSRCGNGVVEGSEECDGNVGSCVGSSACPGFRMCRDDCTFTDCVDGGFGILAGPTPLTTADAPLDGMTRTATTWTGSRYGVAFSGTSPMTAAYWAASFTTLDTGATIDVEPHPVLPSVYGISEAFVAWAPEDEQFGLAMVAEGGVAQGMLNIADPSGWVLIDPGVALPTGESTDVFLSWSTRGYGAAWVAGTGTRQVWFGEYSSDLDELQVYNLVGDSPVLINWLPRVLVEDEDYLVLWHADDVGGTNRSYLMMQEIPHGPPPLPDQVQLFADLQVRPPWSAVMASGEIPLVFSVQPYYDAQVLDLFLASVSLSGETVLEPVEIGSVRRAASRDVEMAWSGSELGVVSATPTGDDASAPRRLTFHRLDIHGEPVTPSVQLTWSGDATMPSAAWDGDAWGVTYAVASEDDPGSTQVEFLRVGCIPPD